MRRVQQHRSRTHHIVKEYINHGASNVAPDVFIGSDSADIGDNTVDPGIHSVSETPPTGWKNTIVQVSGEGCLATEGGHFTGDNLLSAAFNALGGTSGASVDVAPGATCTVTFTNERELGTITVNKVVIGQPGINETGRTFNLLIGGVTYASGVGNGDTTGAQTLTTGNYTISETGTHTPEYSATITCADDGDGIAVGLPTVTLAAGHNIVCTITNRRNPVESAPSITVEKFSDPAGDFTGSGGRIGNWPITIKGLSGPALGKPESTEGDGRAGTEMKNLVSF